METSKVMGCFSLTTNLDGGNGCIAYLPSRITSKVYLAKVFLKFASIHLTCNWSPLLPTVVGRQRIICDPLEYNILQPPTGMSCSEYMGPYIQAVGGYLLNPSANSSCTYCAGDTTDRYLSQTHNIFYDHHWRDLGFLIIYIVFNVSPFNDCTRVVDA